MNQSEVQRLLDIAHSIPMNKVFETHLGKKFLGTHSMAWAKASREYMKAKDELNEGKIR